MEILDGGAGNDFLAGLGGDDLLIGGLGNDTLRGGDGIDTFVYDASDGGADTIADFSASEGEIISIDNALFPNIISLQTISVQQGDDVFIDFGDGNTLTLQGVDLDSLTEENFLFDGALTQGFPATEGSAVAQTLVEGFNPTNDETFDFESSDFAAVETSRSFDEFGGSAFGSSFSNTQDVEVFGRSDFVEGASIEIQSDWFLEADLGFIA